MRHQHPQRNRRIHELLVAHGVAQVGADVLIRVENPLVHHFHQPDARHQLGHGGTAEIGSFVYGHLRRLLLHAVVAFIDDFSVLRHHKRAAHSLRHAECFVRAGIHALFLCHHMHSACRHQQRQDQGHPPLDLPLHYHDDHVLSPLPAP